MRELNVSDLNFCVRRLHPQVKRLLEEQKGKVFLAGGFIRSCVAHEEVNDIDLFVPHVDVVQPLAMALSMAMGISRPLHTTDNAVTIQSKPAVQFVHRWVFDSPQQCLESFDFTIACAAIWYANDKWKSRCHDRFYEDLAAKRLVYQSPVRSEEAGGSLLRALKFTSRGYRIPMNDLGAILARVSMGVKDIGNLSEERRATIFSALMREVDPSVDPTHEAHEATRDDAPVGDFPTGLDLGTRVPSPPDSSGMADMLGDG